MDITAERQTYNCKISAPLPRKSAKAVDFSTTIHNLTYCHLQNTSPDAGSSQGQGTCTRTDYSLGQDKSPCNQKGSQKVQLTPE